MLTKKEEDILYKRHISGRTLKELAVEYGIDKERVRQIEAGALRKLRREHTRKAGIDLFIGVFPGGTSFCDKSREEHGDYKTLAFVSTYGEISYRVPKQELPADVIEAVEAASARYFDEYEKNLKARCKHGGWEAFYRYTEDLSYDAYRRVASGNSLEERIELLLMERRGKVVERR